MTWLKGPVTPLIFFLVFTLLSNCSDNQVDTGNNSEDQAAEKIFNSGEKEILRKRYSDAAEKFTEVERLYPYSDWAKRALIMQVYSYHKDKDYAHFLLAMCFYENIIDEIRNMDTQTLKKETRNYQKEWDVVVKDAFGEFGKYAKASKIIIKKNQLNDPYAEFSLKYKIKSFKGQVRFYMSVKENKPIILMYECINSCPKEYNSLAKMISPTFSENTLVYTKSSTIKKNQNSDIVDQLNSLNELYKSGVLTKEEFEKAKKRILD